MRLYHAWLWIKITRRSSIKKFLSRNPFYLIKVSHRKWVWRRLFQVRKQHNHCTQSRLTTSSHKKVAKDTLLYSARLLTLIINSLFSLCCMMSLSSIIWPIRRNKSKIRSWPMNQSWSRFKNLCRKLFSLQRCFSALQKPKRGLRYTA